MRALHAIFQDGKIFFPFNSPETQGPLKVLVIFPDDIDPFPYDDFFEEEEESIFPGENPLEETAMLPP